MQKSEKLLYKLYDGKTYLKESYKARWTLKMVWLNFYNRDFLAKNNFKFEKGRVHEDVLWTPITFYRAERVMCLNDYFYYYKYNDNSITKLPYKKQNVLDKIFVLSKLKSLCNDFEDIELTRIIQNDIIKKYLYFMYLLEKQKARYEVYKKDEILENVVCSKFIKYKIYVYKKNNFIYFKFFEIMVFFKRIKNFKNKLLLYDMRKQM